MSFQDYFHDNLHQPYLSDPFNVVGEIPIIQTNRLRSYWAINVAGKDVTDRVEPHLIDIRIVDKSVSAELTLELDDRDGTLPIPPLGAPVKVYAGWATESLEGMFNGVVWDIEHAGQRGQGGGRRMFVQAKGVDYINTNIKTPMQDNSGEGAEPSQQEGQKKSLGDWAQQVAGNGGASVSIHPHLANQMRDFWDMSNESPQHHLQRLANDFGGVLRGFAGNHFELTMPGQYVDGSGEGVVVAEVGGNVIAWRVKPLHSMSTWGGASQQHFRTDIGQWLSTAASQSLPAPLSQAIGTWSRGGPAASQSDSQQDAGGDAGQSGYPGMGRIVINGEPTAQWNKHVLLVGARPGVDGLYVIMEAQHHYSRSTGYVTTLEVLTVFAAGGVVTKEQQNIASGLRDPNFVAQKYGLPPVDPTHLGGQPPAGTKPVALPAPQK